MKNTLLYSFIYNNSQQAISSLFIIAGIIWLIVMMVRPSIGFSSFPIGLIVFGLIRLVIYNTKDYIKIFEHYFEIKNSPFSSTVLIKFDDIKNVEDEEKIVSISLFSAHYPLVLYKSRFNKLDFQRFVEILNEFDNPSVRKTIKITDNHLARIDDGFISCNRCNWRGSEDELHSSESDPENYIYCPNCSATFSN